MRICVTANDMHYFVYVCVYVVTTSLLIYKEWCSIHSENAFGGKVCVSRKLSGIKLRRVSY